MAETLLLIAERGADAGLVCVQSTRDYVDGVVRGLPGLKDDWRILASLRDQYARLMEAAPVPFLESLEQMLEAKAEDVLKLFAEGKEVFGGGSMHTGLLWGLETMAWNHEYFERVVLILSRLASLDPGGKLGNRPANSLREIFLWWHPGTNASARQRLAALDLILSKEPEVGWELLTKLRPAATSSISHGTAKPKWRDFGELSEDSRTRNGQFIYMSEIIDRCLNHVGSDPVRWQAVLESMAVISPEQQKRALNMLDHLTKSKEIDSKTSLMFWEALRDFVSKHRRFSDAGWSLSSGIVDQLEGILAKFSPDDVIAKNKWLFDEWFPELPFCEKNIEQQKKLLEQLRSKAVSEILDKEGLKGILTLGTNCKFPGWVASATVPLMNTLEAVFRLTEQAIAEGEAGLSFAGQISGQAKQLFGDEWSKIILKNAKAEIWPPTVAATLLLWWPDNRSTWLDIEAIGEEIAAEYWRSKPLFVIEGELPDQEYQIDHLIEARRASEVFDRLALHSKGIPSQVMLRVFDSTFDELSQAQTAEDVRRLGLNSYDMREFIGQLRKRQDIPREQIACRDYQGVPLLC